MKQLRELRVLDDREVKERLPEDPKLVQSQPTLTENFAVRSVEKRKTVQLQRQTKLRKR